MPIWHICCLKNGWATVHVKIYVLVHTLLLQTLPQPAWHITSQQTHCTSGQQQGGSCGCAGFNCGWVCQADTTVDWKHFVLQLLHIHCTACTSALYIYKFFWKSTLTLQSISTASLCVSEAQGGKFCAPTVFPNFTGSTFIKFWGLWFGRV